MLKSRSGKLIFGKCIIVIICSIINIYEGFTQNMYKHISLEGNFSSNTVIRSDDEKNVLIDNPYNDIYTLRIGFQSTPADSNYYDKVYNYPVSGLALSFTDNSRIKLKNNSIKGDVYSAYWYIDAPIKRFHKFRVDFSFQFGLVYSPKSFDIKDNAWEEYAGYPLLVNVAGSLSLKYMLMRNIEIGIGAEVRHYSNGRMGMPNRGMNMKGINMSMRYLINPVEDFTAPKDVKHEIENKGFNYDLCLVGGIQTSVEQWEMYEEKRDNGEKINTLSFTKSPKLALYNTFLYRYSQMCASGLGLDFFYKQDIENNKKWDKMLYGQDAVKGLKYSRLACGISINHEFYYRNISGFVAVGRYMYREYGIRQNDSRFYQRANLRYHFRKSGNLYIGYGIKAHNFSEAENMEFCIGYKFVKKRK